MDGADLSRPEWARNRKGISLNKFSALLFVVFVVAATAMAGEIYIGAPLVSGEIVMYREDRGTEHMSLSSEQLQAMTRWLEQSRSEWHGVYIEASPNEVVEQKIELKHADGGITSLSVLTGVRGHHWLRLAGPGTWAYRSFGGFFKTWAAMRQISDRDMGKLQELIGSPR